MKKGKPFIMNTTGDNTRVVKIRKDKVRGIIPNPNKAFLEWETVERFERGNYIVLEQRRVYPRVEAR